MRIEVSFAGSDGNLSGLLEMPLSPPRCYTLFAHCFTCTKDIAAASRIARALTQKGIAVLRFDFTGLGNSDGDFANTNFSSNIGDLLKACEFLRQNYQAPQLLIGHSLGGAAILAMADKVPEVKALVTIGAPYNASHVIKNFGDAVEQIEQQGQARVRLGHRHFHIQKQFLDDIDQYQGMGLTQLNKALLIMHAPGDTQVSINEAEKIYQDARHPKSFISLDDADHLLTRKADAEYAANVISAWAGRYISPVQPQTNVAPGQVKVAEKNHKFTQHVSSDSHYWLADEPKDMGGENMGPDPYEHLLAALGACTAMTLRMYATHKKLPLEHVEVTLSHQRQHGKDCADCEGDNLEVIERQITLKGELDQAQRQRLLEIANKCPVHKTLHSHLTVKSVLVDTNRAK
ncbi:bifunctional alpha/beta hydrolase/OsmC family protein [Lacimicrobium alkaliphilum]|uniref:Osmotically inducible protein C n=1 Tax=Lacimicrobium alkaliphilum TaxID=1526571 RepID=A0A0U3ABA1_9ALTE|nr:bifunctional alpha/beta hydrolase/OsmC family protein [Lacimicrobium alkaliphilum]ALS98286.1 osmotically inducible protein C [Lacimicrobium alkaliphilum]